MSHHLDILPRLLTEADAASAIGIDVATFRHLVSCGRLPKPLADVDRYDLKAIHAALDRMSGIGTPANALDAWREKRAS